MSRARPRRSFRVSSPHLCVLVLVALLSAACTSSDPAGPEGSGFVQVFINAEGADADDAVRVNLDGDESVVVKTNASEVFADVPTGEHDLSLSEVADNCIVTPARQQTVFVEPNESSSVTFSLLCDELQGTLVTETRTSGAFPDPDGYSVIIDGLERGRIAPNGALETTLGAGGHEIVLDDLAGNCRPEHSRSRSVIVPSNGTVAVSLDITCAGGLESGQILVASARGQRGEIYRMEADGSNPIRLTEDPWGSFAPSVSPDRQRIAFARYDGSVGGIYVMNGDGSDVREIASGAVSHPEWSPDGTRILFTVDREIWVMNADGSSQQRVRETECIDTDPTWSPTGDHIAFATCEPGSTFEIWVMNSDGSDPRQITSSGDNRDPTWSPDGRKIAFWSFRDGTAEVLTINTDGTSEVVVTAGAAEGYEPAWSPDGTRIAYVGSTATASRALHTVSPDGTERTLIDDGGSNTDPTWVP